ncbi:MAG: LacI family transcriptional regulator [Glaciihabitans sp.]|jgi:LacI family xylobiose transport system transcriptional regulator|nr:LacI family transcriptional regulator [Glaciihabitans sp.]MDQ1569755.1 hypothetical protein [Actinomycetota bacterium]
MSDDVIPRTMNSRATLARVARDASVSMSTVSKVLNGRPGVSDETRVIVERLLESHEYNRRGGIHPHGALIEVVFEFFDSVWSLEIIRGVERVAKENGLSVVLTESGNRHSLAKEWIDGIMQRRPVGVILVFSDLSPEHKRQLRTRNIPFVIVDPAGDPAPDVPSIGSANWAGGVLATRHLIQLGHKRIAMITGPDDLMCSQARVSGFRSALTAAGLPVYDDLILTGAFQREDGVARGRELLTMIDRPTAIFAGNDVQALGLYEAARELGLSIPDDLSVVGYDDVQLAAWVGPPLTTVRQPLIEMAEAATRLVLRLRSEEVVDNLRIDLATSLVVRGSTAAPSA